MLQWRQTCPVSDNNPNDFLTATSVCDIVRGQSGSAVWETRNGVVRAVAVAGGRQSNTFVTVGTISKPRHTSLLHASHCCLFNASMRERRRLQCSQSSTIKLAKLAVHNLVGVSSSRPGPMLAPADTNRHCLMCSDHNSEILGCDQMVRR